MSSGLNIADNPALLLPRGKKDSPPVVNLLSSEDEDEDEGEKSKKPEHPRPMPRNIKYVRHLGEEIDMEKFVNEVANGKRPTDDLEFLPSVTEVDELVIVMRHDFEKMYKGEGRCKIPGMYCFAVYENTGDEDNIVMYPYVKHVAPLRLSRLPTDDQMTHRSKATARGQAPCTRVIRSKNCSVHRTRINPSNCKYIPSFNREGDPAPRFYDSGGCIKCFADSKAKTAKDSKARANKEEEKIKAKAKKAPERDSQGGRERQCCKCPSSSNWHPVGDFDGKNRTCRSCLQKRASNKAQTKMNEADLQAGLATDNMKKCGTMREGCGKHRPIAEFKSIHHASGKDMDEHDLCSACRIGNSGTYRAAMGNFVKYQIYKHGRYPTDAPLKDTATTAATTAAASSSDALFDATATAPGAVPKADNKVYREHFQKMVKKENIAMNDDGSVNILELAKKRIDMYKCIADGSSRNSRFQSGIRGSKKSKAKPIQNFNGKKVCDLDEEDIKLLTETIKTKLNTRKSSHKCNGPHPDNNCDCLTSMKDNEYWDRQEENFRDYVDFMAAFFELDHWLKEMKFKAVSEIALLKTIIPFLFEHLLTFLRCTICHSVKTQKFDRQESHM